jgi:lysophospholipase L1-like esterase
VINRSRAGETSFDGVNSFYEDIAPLKPDLLMLHFGIDDAFRAVYRSEFKENLVRIIRLARACLHADIVLVTSHPFDKPDEKEAANIYYRAIREVSVDLGCSMIPVHTYWAGYLSEWGLNPSDLLLQDPRYPNERGHGVYAEAMIRWFATLYDM